MKSKLHNFPSLILALCIWSLILLVPLVALASSKQYFLQKFSEYQVYQNFPSHYSPEYLNQQFVQILAYTNQQPLELDTSFFAYEDIVHMQDVRRLMFFAYILVGVSFSVMLYALARQQFHSLFLAVKQALILLIGALCFLVFYGAGNFEHFFLKFHETLFFNDYWLLDPASSNLIKYLPQEIFADFFQSYLKSVGILVFFLVGFVIIITWHKPKKS